MNKKHRKLINADDAWQEESVFTESLQMGTQINPNTV